MSGWHENEDADRPHRGYVRGRCLPRAAPFLPDLDIGTWRGVGPYVRCAWTIPTTLPRAAGHWTRCRIHGRQKHARQNWGEQRPMSIRAGDMLIVTRTIDRAPPQSDHIGRYYQSPDGVAPSPPPLSDSLATSCARCAPMDVVHSNTPLGLAST